MIVNMLIDTVALYSSIVVTATTGSTVTCTTPSGTVLTATEISGTWTFSGLTEKGTYTVDGTYGSTGGSQEVLVDTFAVYQITLTYYTIITAIPTMTSNTTPSGVVSYSSYNGSSEAGYYAFDNNTSTLWSSNFGVSPPQWVQYKCADGSRMKFSTITYYNSTDNGYGTTSTGYVSVSDDGSTFETIYSFSALAAGATHTFSIGRSVMCQYIRITFTAYNNTLYGHGCRVYNMQISS